MKLYKFECADFKYDNIIFKFQPKDTQIKHFRSQIWAFFILHLTLHQEKFKDADFKCDNIFFQIPAQKYPNMVFLVPNLEFFSRNFAIRQIWGCWFQKWQKFFKNSSPKIPTWGFLGPKFGIFIISQYFAIRQIWGSSFKIWQ